MKTNVYILEQFYKGVTEPNFALEEVGFANFGYYKPYGLGYLPPPKPYFPVNNQLTYCHDLYSLTMQIIFMVQVPQELQSNLPQLHVIFSGDKLFRNCYNFFCDLHPWQSDIYYTYIETIGQIKKLEDFKSLNFLEKIKEFYTTKFWRARFYRASYQSAFSEIVSFNINFKWADVVSEFRKWNGAIFYDTSEAGFFFDGNFYYP